MSYTYLSLSYHVISHLGRVDGNLHELPARAPDIGVGCDCIALCWVVWDLNPDVDKVLIGKAILNCWRWWPSCCYRWSPCSRSWRCRHSQSRWRWRCCRSRSRCIPSPGWSPRHQTLRIFLLELRLELNNGIKLKKTRCMVETKTYIFKLRYDNPKHSNDSTGIIKFPL